jgi:hypothetical protein
MATLDTKLSILTKLGIAFSLTVFDKESGCDSGKWVEQFSAARGGDMASEWFKDFVQYSNTFVIGGAEIKRYLSSLEVMYHSKLMPISKYIKRIRDYKNMNNYEELLKQHDYVYFILAIALGYGKIMAKSFDFKMHIRDIIVLVYLYMKHTPLNNFEIKRALQTNVNVKMSLLTLHSLGYISVLPLKNMAGSKRGGMRYIINENGIAVIHQVCMRMLSYL